MLVRHCSSMQRSIQRGNSAAVTLTIQCTGSTLFHGIHIIRLCLHIVGTGPVLLKKRLPMGGLCSAVLPARDRSTMGLGKGAP